MKTVLLPCGAQVPALGQGTWRMGEDSSRRVQEVGALRAGIDLGMTLIDTAEMYGEGGAEKVVGEAISGQREKVFLVSKVYPHNASRAGAVKACERSLRRLGVECLDLYLLHWRGSIPLSETMEAFVALQDSGKIRHYGVSNLDRADMSELISSSAGKQVQTNQLLYNLARRGIEWDLLPWLRERRIPVMAYSPVEQGRLLDDAKLKDFSKRHDMTPAQAALAWLLTKGDVIAIPKSAQKKRLEENFGALAVKLDAAALAELDRSFPPPAKAGPLDML